ncbi:MAG: alpha/beta hydrolase, partial [Actinobacteria bacterium]|nr:alpha/beta hydrolase [Actinomycetota bacterium]
FPDTVRAAVFDAAADPTLDVIDWLTFQSIGFENSLNAFLDECDAVGCEFVPDESDARSEFDRLMTSLATDPLVVSDDRPPVGESVAQIAVFTALYGSSAWASLDRALAEAARGYGDRLLSLYDSYFGGWRAGHPDDSIDSYVAITCLDRETDFSVDDAFRAMEELDRVSPRLGDSVLYELLLCAQWPVKPNPAPEVEWSGRTPLLVIGSTGDPATPLAGTRRMRDTLGNARLVVVDSFDHTSYGTVECATRAVDAYLIDPDGTTGDVEC